MRYWYNGITSVFQTENTCPIQVYRTLLILILVEIPKEMV
jgi:hypothetical protein